MAKKSKSPNPFMGRWRIVSMEMWDQDYVDEEEEGYFEFTDNGWGEFRAHGQRPRYAAGPCHEAAFR